MKHKELRIGSWVGVSSMHFKGNAQVIDVLCDSINIESIECLPYDMVEPIVLTKENLIKAGAKVMEGGVYISIPNIGAELHFEIFSNTAEIVTTIKGSFSDLILDRIYYFHQLQNLYLVLANNELIIDNL